MRKPGEVGRYGMRTLTTNLKFRKTRYTPQNKAELFFVSHTALLRPG